MSEEGMIIGVDFDGTVVKHMFPEVGEPVPHALRVMKRLQANGHRLVLWTMRSDIDGERSVLTEALDYLNGKIAPLFGINGNPEQESWTASPKAYCHVYIDDAALGCPLIHPQISMATDVPDERPFVDWLRVEQMLADQGYFQEI